jgi:MFS family permease
MRMLLALPTTQLIVCFIAFSQAIFYGFSFPFYSLVLEGRGASSTEIGLNAMVGTLGVLLIGPLMPRVMVRVGYRDFCFASMAMVVASFVLLLVDAGSVALFASRALLGIGLACLWVASGAWLNHLAADENRGLVNGFFQMCYATGFVVGPNIIYLTGTDGIAAPMLASAIGLGALAVMVAFAGRLAGAPICERGRPLRWDRAWKARGLLLIALLTGVAETALYTLLPVFGLALGQPMNLALGVLVVYTIGEAALTMPLGYLADRMDRRRLLAIASLIASVSVAAIALVVQAPLFGWVAAFIAGGTVVGLYNLALVVVGETQKGADLPIVSTAFSMAYAVGCTVGATVGGVMMDVFGPLGLTGSISLVLCLFGLAVMYVFGALPRPEPAIGRSYHPPATPAE